MNHSATAVKASVWALLLLAVAGGACTPGAAGPQQPGGVPADLSAKAAAEQIKGNPDAFVLDVRGHDEYLTEHIAGSVLIPLHVLEQHIARNTIYPDINKGRTPRRDQLIICVCAWGGRSGQAARTLRAMGYTDVRNLTGGMTAWRRAGLPVVKPPEKPEE
jgi:rhodanese-related sulfurtransferase